jgi:hypothetical protein
MHGATIKIKKNFSSLHTMPAFYDQCEVNFTLITKIQTRETVDHRPIATETSSTRNLL